MSLTGAKGLNLAVADVALLARALTALLRKNDTILAEAYSDTALRRVWRCTHFSWWMTAMVHAGRDPFDAQLQLSQVQWVATSGAGATGLAENYARSTHRVLNVPEGGRRRRGYRPCV